MMEKKYQLVAWTRNITDPERAYEESAKLEFLTGHLDDAVRFLFMAADYAHRRKELRNEFVRLCEEAISLGKKYGFEYIFKEEKPKMTLGRYRHIKKDPAR